MFIEIEITDTRADKRNWALDIARQAARKITQECIGHPQ
jgi:hypothetical protein